MNEQAVLRLIVLGFWTPAIILVASYATFRYFELQRQRRLEERRDMMSEERRYRSEHDTARMQSEFRSSIELLQKAFESRLEDLGPRINRSVQSALESSVKGLRAGKRESNEPATVDQSGLLIREVSHALNTPLSHIEAGLLTLDAEAAKSQRADLQEHLATVLTGVQTCKSVIAGFREAILATRSTSTWSPASLHDAILSAAGTDAARFGRDLNVDVGLPHVISGFSNNYLVTILLPLIENAIEAARPGTSISIKSRKANGVVYLDVNGTPESAPESNKIYDDGFTTKPGHSGTGLSIVRHLIAPRPGARLTHKVDGASVTFTIALPTGG